VTDWQIAVFLVTLAAVFAAGYLHGEHRQRLAELRHRNELRRLLEEIHRERGAITLDAVGWVWAALAVWGVAMLTVWWFGS
jgi:hypothetical protein